MSFIMLLRQNINRVYENIGTAKGFQGCIKKLKIGRQEIELHMNQHDWVLKTNDIHDCSEHACTHSPCLNNGKCLATDDLYRCDCQPRYTGEFCEKPEDPCTSTPCRYGSKCKAVGFDSFICECPLGRSGQHCELEYKDARVVTPEFNGSSFIRFPRLGGIKKKFSIEVSFMPEAPNGLILYNGQMKNGRGDFISLNLAGGHLQFRFNLGSGIANLTSREPVTLGKWHWARISREGREGILQLDNSSIVRGFSGNPLTELNLETPFYIGSLANWKEIHRLSGSSKGFRGAIQRIIVNGNPLPISAVLPYCGASSSHNKSGCTFDVGYYDGLPCSANKNPCLNNGVCVPELEDFTCQCSSSYKGKYCETVNEDSLAIKFNGNTYLQYRNRGYRSDSVFDDVDEMEENFNRTSEEYDINDVNSNEFYDFNLDFDQMERKPERGNRYELHVRTFASDGLLLWRSKNRNLAEDYLSVAIVDGFAELSYNLGQQHSFWVVRSKTRIDDGQWHTIQVRRRKRVGFISVDGKFPTKGIVRSGAISLRTNSKLWIGGTSSLPPGLPSAYYRGFEGCIKKIVVNTRQLDMLGNNDISKINFCHDNEI